MKRQAFEAIISVFNIMGLFLISLSIIESVCETKVQVPKERGFFEEKQEMASARYEEVVLEELQAEFDGLAIWLQMAEDLPSMFIYSTWKNELQDRFTGIENGYAMLEQMSDESSGILSARDQYLVIKGLIVEGAAKGDIEMIRKARLMIRRSQND